MLGADRGGGRGPRRLGTSDARRSLEALEDDGGQRGELHVERVAVDDAVITVVAAAIVLALDENWFAFGLLSVAFLVVVGILAGMALSLYVIWLRYGTS